MVMTKKETKQQEALTSAHNDYGKGLNSYAFFKLRDHAVGEDMVQDTFLKTWSYIVRGGKIQTMRAFLYHILNNLIVDQYRKKKNKNASLDAMLENGYEPSGTDSENPFNTLGGKMAFPLIQRLPEKYKKVMRMKYVQLLNLEEISLLLGQTKNATAVQLHRGL
jgi:RNA polymerase sigma-70 factor (ECF subfamily)